MKGIEENECFTSIVSLSFKMPDSGMERPQYQVALHELVNQHSFDAERPLTMPIFSEPTRITPSINYSAPF